MLTTPLEIAPLLKDKTVENVFFRKFLRDRASSHIDARIYELALTVSAQVDCLACANCCKKLEPGVESHEIEKLAELKHQAVEDFKEQYIAFDGDALYLQTKPCMFLDNCSCSIYEHRPAACSGYPHLDQPDMKYRRSLWENYTICPIVYNVLEELKEELGFKNPLSK